MSAGIGRLQAWPRWGEKFSQMFVIMSEGKEAKHQARISLAKERDFLPSAEGMDPEKRCVISILLPVWSERKLSAHCAACFQGWSGTDMGRGGRGTLLKEWWSPAPLTVNMRVLSVT